MGEAKVDMISWYEINGPKDSGSPLRIIFKAELETITNSKTMIRTDVEKTGIGSIIQHKAAKKSIEIILFSTRERLDNG